MRSLADAGLRDDVGPAVSAAGAPPALATAITGLVQAILDELVSRGVRGLAICGVAEGDGVSFLSANLAAGLARAGLSTLLVDADICTPLQHILFDVSEGATFGLSEVLKSNSPDPDAGIRPNVRPGLSVLFGGEAQPGVPDALSGAAFASLMDGWLRSYEFTIVDTPPANRTPDALRIARLAGHALLVVRRDQTFVSDLSLFIEELRDQNVTVFGSVLNEG